MTPSSEQQIIEQKLQELSALSEQREQIQAKIVKTEAAIRAFIALLEDGVSQHLYTIKLKMAANPVGLTEAIKRIMFMEKPEPLEATAVRQRLEESGFPLSGYASPLAVIHTTLGRLEQQGLLESTKNGYRWIGEMYGLDGKSGSRPRVVMRPPKWAR